MPLVSVIIPTHNRAESLPSAITSVLHQSFSDIEIIVVDDGSTDLTNEVRDRFADRGIRWFRHEVSKGGAAARNSGILHSRGKYVAFLDDDDEWHAEKLARQMAVIVPSAEKVGAVFTGYQVIEAKTGRVIGQKVPAKRGDLYPELLEGNYIGGTSCMLVKRACLEKIGCFDERLPSFQDYDLWMRISSEFHFDYVADPLVKYYVHTRQIWTDDEALLRGLDIMLQKHGRSAAFRRYCSVFYLSHGVKFCEVQRLAEARKAFSRAIELNPYGVRPYLYFALSLGGPTTFSTARAARARVAGLIGRQH